METETTEHTDTAGGGIVHTSRLFGRLTVRALSHFVRRSIMEIVLEFELFLGSLLLTLGLISFESDKFCDGNTADYLSCTRPSTYYYFDTLDKVLIILGLFLLLLWYLRRSRS